MESLILSQGDQTTSVGDVPMGELLASLGVSNCTNDHPQLTPRIKTVGLSYLATLGCASKWPHLIGGWSQARGELKVEGELM